MENKRRKIKYDYSLHDQPLTAIEHHQYLGVFLSLKWDHHYNYITKKANQVLGVLGRNLKGCSRATKSTAYLALVRLHLEYAICVCTPYETKYINQLEMVQRRAARFDCNNYNKQASVTDMINDWGGIYWNTDTQSQGLLS